MILKNQQNLNDEFVSIHELRERNRLKSNYFKVQQKNINMAKQQRSSIDFITQWDKFKSYVVDIAENLINEPSDVSDHYSGTDFNSRNLMLAIDSGPEIKYGSIGVGRFKSSKGLFLILNDALKSIEKLLRNIQIGMILDAETLEFNLESCDKYVGEHLPQSNEVLLLSVHDDQRLHEKKAGKKCIESFTRSFQKILSFIINILNTNEDLKFEYFPYSVQKGNGGGNDP